MLEYLTGYEKRFPEDREMVRALRRRVRLTHRVGLVWGWASAKSDEERARLRALARQDAARHRARVVTQCGELRGIEAGESRAPGAFTREASRRDASLLDAKQRSKPRKNKLRSRSVERRRLRRERRRRLRVEARSDETASEQVHVLTVERAADEQVGGGVDALQAERLPRRHRVERRRRVDARTTLGLALITKYT